MYFYSLDECSELSNGGLSDGEGDLTVKCLPQTKDDNMVSNGLLHSKLQEVSWRLTLI